MERKDLKDGEIYVYGENYINKIGKPRIGSEKMNIVYWISKKTHSFNNSSTYGTCNNTNFIRKATAEEKHWLQLCINNNRYISYEEAMKTFVKDFVLPEKWKVIIDEKSRLEIGDKYKPFVDYYNRFYIYSHIVNKHEGWKYNKYIGGGNLHEYNEITLEQFKKYVLKEDDKPYKILKQQGNRIIQVSNSEGSIFDIGDSIKSINSNVKGFINKFRYNRIGNKEDPNKSNIIAIVSFNKYGISIDKIEHYIEPEVEEFVLPEKWYINITKENRNVVLDWFRKKINLDRGLSYINTSHLVGIPKTNYNQNTPGFNPKGITKGTNYDFGNEITFDQFKQYVLGEKPEVKPNLDKWINQKNSYLDSVQTAIRIAKNSTFGINEVRLPIKGEVIIANGHVQQQELKEQGIEAVVVQPEVEEESLLDKAKRLYPIGTKFINPVDNAERVIIHYNYYEGTNNNIYCAVTEGSDNYNEGLSGCLYLAGQWAEIIKPNDSEYEILSFKNGYEYRLLPNSKYRSDIKGDKEWTLDEMMFHKMNIHSIKQLSTGNVFTVGNSVKFKVSYNVEQFVMDKINKITLSENNNIVFHLNQKGTVLLKNVEKV